MRDPLLPFKIKVYEKESDIPREAEKADAQRGDE